MRAALKGGLLLCSLCWSVSVLAASMIATLPGVGAVGVSVQSVKERVFRNTVRQRYDFSCGSAALATLLTYHYAEPTTEEQVFKSMFADGDQERIMKVGFSMADMKRYLASLGLEANGYRVSFDKLAELAVPAIVLLNHQGYRHFVVVKGMDAERVLVGDSALGTRTISRKEFEKMWSGVLFVILNRKQQGQASFNRSAEWRLREPAPLSVTRPSPIADLYVLLPRSGDF